MDSYFAFEPEDIGDAYGTQGVEITPERRDGFEVELQARDWEHACSVWRGLNGDPDGLCNYVFRGPV